MRIGPDQFVALAAPAGSPEDDLTLMSGNDCICLQVRRSFAMTDSINLADKLSRIPEHWSPRIIARMNDYDFKLVKLKGEFIWHDHKDTDETFIVLEGELTIHLRDRDVILRRGEMFVVPKGVEHKPEAARECHLMLIEPVGTVNTGDAGGAMTAPSDVWI
jgi:mannose-6-phosphate isomerase-like protein (cupin superfamily)